MKSYICRVPTAQEKQGKWPKKNPCQGKHREFGNFAKTQGILFAQVLDSKDTGNCNICLKSCHFFKVGLPHEIVANF